MAGQWSWSLGSLLKDPAGESARREEGGVGAGGRWERNEFRMRCWDPRRTVSTFIYLCIYLFNFVWFSYVFLIQYSTLIHYSILIPCTLPSFYLSNLQFPSLLVLLFCASILCFSLPPVLACSLIPLRLILLPLLRVITQNSRFWWDLARMKGTSDLLWLCWSVSLVQWKEILVA